MFFAQLFGKKKPMNMPPAVAFVPGTATPPRSDAGVSGPPALAGQPMSPHSINPTVKHSHSVGPGAGSRVYPSPIPTRSASSPPFTSPFTHFPIPPFMADLYAGPNHGELMQIVVKLTPHELQTLVELFPYLACSPGWHWYDAYMSMLAEEAVESMMETPQPHPFMPPHMPFMPAEPMNPMANPYAHPHVNDYFSIPLRAAGRYPPMMPFA